MTPVLVIKMRLFLSAILCSLGLIAQTSQPVPLRVYNLDNITSDTIIDARNTVNRYFTYVSISCIGSSTWDAQLEYSSSASGPWTVYGSSATIDETSDPPIAWGFSYTPKSYLRVNIVSGSPTCRLSASQNFYVGGGSGGGVSFPISITNGGTSATTALGARTALGIPWVYNGSSINYSLGNVGIDRSSPAEKLDVNGTIIARNRMQILGTTTPSARGGVEFSYDPTGGDGTGSGGIEVLNPNTLASKPFNWVALDHRFYVGPSSAPVNTMRISPTGNILFYPDNTYDIGATADNRPHDVHIGRNLNVGGTTTLTTPLATTSGGTGANTVRAARINLGEDARRNDNYIFSYTNGGSNVSANLSVTGSKTFTMTPCPYGVAGSNAGHSLYISGGTGTAEVVVITGGTCTSGASSGTITATITNTHTGAWSIATATAGLQEAFYSAAPSNIYLTNGAWTVYGTLTLWGQGGNTTKLTGDGFTASRLIRASTFTNGDMIFFDGSLGSGELIIQDIGLINAGASSNILPVIGSCTGSPIYCGSALRLKENYTSYIQRIYIADGWRHIHTEGTGALAHIQDSEFRYSAAYLRAAVVGSAQSTAQILIDSATIDFTNNEVVQSVGTSGSANLYGDAVPSIVIKRGDGHTIENNRIGGSDGITFSHGAAQPLNFVYIRNNVINGLWRFGIYFTADTAGGYEFQNFIISNNDIISQFQFAPYVSSGPYPPQHTAIYSNNADLAGVEVSSNLIAGWGYDCVFVNNGKYWNFVGNTIRDCNASNTTGSGIYLAGTGVGNSVTSNYSGYITGIAGVTRYPYQTAGLYITGTQANLNAQNNNFNYNAVYPLALIGSPTITGTIANNNGVDNLFETIASGLTPGTITSLTTGSKFNITGVTNITTILPAWNGKTVTLQKLDATTITVGGGGNIASAAVNLTQFGTVVCTYNGSATKWLCK